MNTRIGTCSECGGPVIVPAMMVNPTPYCDSCGAIARNPQPVIPMQPQREWKLPETRWRLTDEQWDGVRDRIMRYPYFW
jgi:hypothetical protein